MKRRRRVKPGTPCLCGHPPDHHTQKGKFKGLCDHCTCELYEPIASGICGARYGYPSKVCTQPNGHRGACRSAAAAIATTPTLAPDRAALPGQLGMLGAASRQPDGRSGKVFSIRLSDVERKFIEDARHREAELARTEGKYRSTRPLGLWIREAALTRAVAVLDSSPAPRR